jgi:hypothetical protein
VRETDTKGHVKHHSSTKLPGQAEPQGQTQWVPWAGRKEQDRLPVGLGILLRAMKML